jgi:hypothetical protein
MPGKWITDKQVKIYINSRKSGNTQELSSAKAGILVRSGRAIDQLIHGGFLKLGTGSKHTNT